MTVVNPGFESGSLSGWTTISSGGYGSGSWVVNNVTDQSNQYPTFSNPLPGTASGTYYGAVQGYDGNSATMMFQDVSANGQGNGQLQPNTTYTLTVAIGVGRYDAHPNIGGIALIDGTSPSTGTVLATGSASTLNLSQYANNFKDLTVSFTTGSVVSGDLTIEAFTNVGYSYYDSMKVDNVRLTRVSSVPNLVSDGFDNGTRLSGSTALAVSFYSMNGPGTDLSIVNDNVSGGINSGNALKVTLSGSAEGVVAQLPNSVALMDGQSISLSFNYRFTGTTNLNQAGLFRFGFLDSRGTPSEPPVGQGDNDPYMRVDDCGYYAATNPGLASSGGTTLCKLGNWLDGPTGSPTTYTPTLSGTTALETVSTGTSINAGTTVHTAQMTIARSGTSLTYSVSLDGLPAASGTESDPYTYVFDSIAIATGTGSVPSPFLIDNVVVNYSSPSGRQNYPGLGVQLPVGFADATWTTNYNTFLSSVGASAAYYTPSFCDGSPLHGASGSMTSAAAYEAGIQYNNTTSRLLTPIASIPLANQASKGNETATIADFNAIVSGTYDSDYNSVFSSYASRWSTIYLRIGWEQNDSGSNYPWYAHGDSTCETAYTAAWKHVANLAHAYATAHGVTIKTVWCPATVNYFSGAGSTYPVDAGYVPNGTGDQYVDVVGIDIYTQVYLSNDGNGKYWDYALGYEVADVTTFASGTGSAVNRGHWLDYPGGNRWAQFSVGGGSLAWVINVAQAHLKPLCVPETGSGNNGSTTGPVDDPVLPLYLSNRLSQAIAQGTHVLFVAPWDEGSGYVFTTGSKPLQVAAWQQFIKNMAALSQY